MLRIVTPDGRPLPAGTEVRVNEQSEPSVVAIDGALCATGLNADNYLSVQSNGLPCEAVFAFRRSTEPIPNLGDVVCKTLAP